MPSHRAADAVKRPMFREWHVDATAFLYEIVRTAETLKDAKTFDDDPALYLGTRCRQLRAIERCGGAPSFTHLGRVLKISRQAARELAIKSARGGVVELLMSPDDRRALQVALTPAGRRELERQRMPEFGWTFTLLNGLHDDVIRETHHVLEVIRRRLERQAGEMRAARRSPNQRGIGSPFKKAMSPRTWR
jgi:DNA-binding MarR family transcriptional regulator